MFAFTRRYALLTIVTLGLLVGSLAGTALCTAASPLRGSIDFMVWGDTFSDHVENLVIAAFESKNPDVKVNLLNSGGNSAAHFEKLLTMIAGGTPPDVALVDGYDYPGIAHAGHALDVTEWARRDNVRADLILPAYWQEMTYNGRLYSVANVRSGYLIIFYNQNLFEEAGVSGPYGHGGWTWQGLLDAAKRITQDTSGDGRPDRWGVQPTADWAFWPWVWMNGGTVFNADRTQCTLDEPKATQALQWLADLTAKHVVTGSVSNFVKGTLGMSIDWATTKVTTFRQAANFDWDIAALPAGPISQVTAAKGNEIVIPVGSRNKELAWEFMKFLGDEEAQYIYGTQGRFFPVHRRAGQRLVMDARSRNLKPDHLLILTEMNARALPLIPGFGDLRQMWREPMKQAIAGTISAQQAAVTMVAQAAPILSKNRTP